MGTSSEGAVRMGPVSKVTRATTRTRYRCLFLALLGMVVLGCGGGDDDDDSAVEQCEALVQHYCSKFEECSSGTAEECAVDSQESLPCDRAVAVGSSFDRCIQAVDAMTCPDGPALPESCNGVVLLR